MRTLRDEVINRGIPVVEFTSAVELIKDEKGQVAGAVLLNMETEDYMVAKAKPSSLQQEEQDAFTTRTSLHQTITAQQQTDLFSATAQAHRFFTRIPFSITQQALHIRHRFTALL